MLKGLAQHKTINIKRSPLVRKNEVERLRKTEKQDKPKCLEGMEDKQEITHQQPLQEFLSDNPAYGSPLSQRVPRIDCTLRCQSDRGARKPNRQCNKKGTVTRDGSK